MRRTVPVLAMMAVGVVLLASGAASAYEPAPDPEPTMRCDRSGGPCAGTDRGDAIYGSKVADVIRARAGQDWANAKAGDDALYGGTDGGTDGDDLRGGRGRDDLHGGAERDWLAGDEGDDTLHGGPGDDHVWSTGSGADRLYGGDGDDHLYLSEHDDGAQDRLHCGEGHDMYFLPGPLDAADRVSASCEVPGDPYQPPVPPPWFIWD